MQRIIISIKRENIQLLDRSPTTIYANVKPCECAYQRRKSVICIFHKARIIGNSLQLRENLGNISSCYEFAGKLEIPTKNQVEVLGISLKDRNGSVFIRIVIIITSYNYFLFNDKTRTVTATNISSLCNSIISRQLTVIPAIGIISKSKASKFFVNFILFLKFHSHVVCLSYVESCKLRSNINANYQRLYKRINKYLLFQD